MPTPHPAAVPGGLWVGDYGSPAVELLCLGYMKNNRNWNFAHVFSPFWRLYYNEQPGHWIEVQGARISLAPDSFVLIPSNILFECRSGGTASHLYLHFSLKLPVDRRAASVIKIKATAPTIGLFQELRHNLRNPGATSQHLYRAYHLAHGLLHALLSRMQPAEDRNVSQLMQRAIQQIEDNPTFSVAGLAACLGVVPRTLQREFLHYLGIGPKHVMQDIRLRQAATRLVNSQESIETIAENFGFRDRYHFTRAFSRSFNIAPAQFRKKYRQKTPSILA